MEVGKIIYYGKVIDADDLLRLGRLRVAPLSQNQQEIASSAIEACKESSGQGLNDDVIVKCRWTQNDPFLVQPLLPYTLNITPKKDEIVMLIYPMVQNAESSTTLFSNNFKYYIPMSPTTPLRVVYENFQTGKQSTPLGFNLKSNKNFKEFGGNIASSTFGIFPEPDDNAVLGKGSTDLILKENDLLLRAGKTLGLGENVNNFPTVFDNRAFIQLSLQRTTTTKLPIENTEKISLKYPNINYIIEWDVENPENEQNVFTVALRLYEITSTSDKINTRNLTVDSDIQDIIQSSRIAKSLRITAESFESCITKINNFIKEWNDTSLTYSSKPSFPFAYRPSQMTYKKMINTDSGNPISGLVEGVNISRFFNKICLNPGLNSFGFGIVYSKGSMMPPLQIAKGKQIPKTNQSSPQTFGVFGADNIVLLSHKSQTSKGAINLRDTIYGIDFEKLSKLEEKTEPMVRGESLMDLINLIFKFLIAHVHPYHGVPPVPTALDGTLSADIQQKVLNAGQTILNDKIRIN
jgi:hypothetical protein